MHHSCYLLNSVFADYFNVNSMNPFFFYSTLFLTLLRITELDSCSFKKKFSGQNLFCNEKNQGMIRIQEDFTNAHALPKCSSLELHTKSAVFFQK